MQQPTVCSPGVNCNYPPMQYIQSVGQTIYQPQPQPQPKQTLLDQQLSKYYTSQPQDYKPFEKPFVASCNSSPDKTTSPSYSLFTK